MKIIFQLKSYVIKFILLKIFSKQCVFTSIFRQSKSHTENNQFIPFSFFCIFLIKIWKKSYFFAFFIYFHPFFPYISIYFDQFWSYIHIIFNEFDCGRPANRKHRVKVGNSLSTWLHLHIGVPQGSVLRPLLFNIFLSDIFFFILYSLICNFADDKSLHSSRISFDLVIRDLKCDALNCINWLSSTPCQQIQKKMFLGVC